MQYEDENFQYRQIQIANGSWREANYTSLYQCHKIPTSLILHMRKEHSGTILHASIVKLHALWEK